MGHLGRFLKELRSESYDAVVDLQGLLKSAIVVASSRSKSKIGFRGGKEAAAAWVLNQPQPAYDPDRHALSRYLDLLGPLGFSRPAEPRFGLAPAPEHLARAGELLAGAGSDGPLVICHPRALWDSKLWPVEHWRDLVDRLLAAGCRVAVSGGPGDGEVTGAIVSSLAEKPGLVDLTGVTDLKTLAALLTLAKLVICTDTGVMHLAAAMGTRVLALFGPTAPWRTGPWGDNHVVMRLGLECSPCFQRQCGQARCLSALSPLGVFNQAQGMLAGVSGPSPSRTEL